VQILTFAHHRKKQQQKKQKFIIRKIPKTLEIQEEQALLGTGYHWN